MRWRGVLLLGIACVLPLAAIHLAKRMSIGAVGTVAAAPAHSPPAGKGLAPLVYRQDIHPAELASRYVIRFPLGNGTDRSIAVVGATTTCGCAALRVVPPVVSPGSWGEAIVEMAGRGRFGAVEAQIDLRTDDGRPPVILQARLLLPPQPKIGGDEIRVPAGASEVIVPVSGGNDRFAMRCLDGPHVSGSAFTVGFEAAESGARLICRLVGVRPAAARVRVRLGYDAEHAVDLPVRIIAE